MLLNLSEVDLGLPAHTAVFTMFTEKMMSSHFHSSTKIKLLSLYKSHSDYKVCARLWAIFTIY